MSSTVSLLNRQSLLTRSTRGRETEISSLQDALRRSGAYNGPSNGRFDAQTDAAVRRFQRQNNLKVDGKVGDQTWARLLGRSDTFEPGTRHMNRNGGYNPQAPQGAPERVVPESVRQSAIDVARQQQQPIEMTPF